MEYEKTRIGFIEATKDKLREAEQRYGVDFSQTEISFNLRGSSTCGRAEYIGGRTRIIFNNQNLMHRWDDMLGDTLPHEVAHLVCFLKGWDKGHGPKWKQVCKELGGNGQRCASADLHYIGINGSWKYRGASGKIHWINKRAAHQNIQRGIRVTVGGDPVDMFGYLGYMQPNGVFKPVAASVSVASSTDASDTGSSASAAEQHVSKRLKQRYSTGVDAMFDLKTASVIASEVGIVNSGQARNFVKQAIIDTFDDLAHLR